MVWSIWPLRGSPPRAWGGPAQFDKIPTYPRITPTCVGRTTADGPSSAGSTDHPHVRGEDGESWERVARLAGSPPRAWGGPAERERRDAEVRITPTCVGRTRPRPRIRRTTSDHPHVRGEDVDPAGDGVDRIGSPPRAWGGRTPLAPRFRPGRITPTCVGRTTGAPQEPAHASDHPHVRGEDLPDRTRPPVDPGSPPRAWGGRHDPAAGRVQDGITPTCVGRTASWARRARASADHPHVRGEDLSGAADLNPDNGSPPRAWGGLGNAATREDVAWITPTCVGRTAGAG